MNEGLARTLVLVLLMAAGVHDWTPAFIGIIDLAISGNLGLHCMYVWPAVLARHKPYG